MFAGNLASKSTKSSVFKVLVKKEEWGFGNFYLHNH